MALKKARKNPTIGVQPRADQLIALEELKKLDAELTLAIAVRRGLDLFFAEKMAQQAVMPQVFRNISIYLGHGNADRPKPKKKKRGQVIAGPQRPHTA